MAASVGPRLQGVENLLVPSFSADLRRLDEAAIELDVRQSAAHGVVATALALESGLTPVEQRRFIAVACEAARGKVGVSLLLPAPEPSDLPGLLAHAVACGVSHVHIGCPSGFDPRGDADVVEWVQRVAAMSGLPLCLLADRFAFPRLHPSGLPLAALETLAADCPAVVALELASLDAGLIAECCERFAGRWLVGSPHLGLQPMLVQNFGCARSGPWPIEALQSPSSPHVVRLLGLLREGRSEEAMQIYWSLAPALGAAARVTASFAHSGVQHWPLVKYQQWLSGGNGGLTRQPVMRLYQRDMQATRAGLAAIGIHCADPDEAFFAGRQGRGANA